MQTDSSRLQKENQDLVKGHKSSPSRLNLQHLVDEITLGHQEFQILCLSPPKSINSKE